MGGQNVDVTIRGIGSGGSGIGDLPDGRVVFVPRTVAGDRVRIRIEKSKPRWAVGSLVRLIDAGPDRVDAVCPLYEKCGGCQLQHLSYDRQLEAKARFVSDALGRIGGFDAVEVPQVVGSPQTVEYRNRVTYTLRRLRGGYVVAGFHALGRPAHVIDVQGQCVLPVPELRDAWLRVRAGWGERACHLPAGGRLRVTLRVASAGIELVVQGGAAEWDPTPLTDAVVGLAAVWHVPADHDEPLLVAGVSEPGGGIAFEQVNSEAAALLAAHVAEVAESGARSLDGTRRHAVDAYCGVGTYGRALADAGWLVHGIEVDPQAVRAASTHAPAGFEAIADRVENRLAELLPADLLLLNPPRSGLHPDVPAIIAAKGPPVMIYVSCDPATLARDLRGLDGRYDLVSVRCFDLFPQTAHVEVVAVLTRREEAE